MRKLRVGAYITLGTLGVFILLRTTGLLERALSPGAYQPINFQAVTLTDTPNQFLACPADYCRPATPHIKVPTFNISADQLRAAFERLILSSADPMIANQTAGSVDFVVRTPVMRWPDWVSVRFINVGADQSTLAVYSRSVFGYDDFGTNETRVREWIRVLGQSQN